MIRGPGVCLDVHSRIEILDFVLAVTDRVGRHAGLGDESRQSVALAVREAVLNAITHGNDTDETKRIQIEISPVDKDGPGLAIRVRDQGCGFDPAGVPDCRAPDHVLKPHGRGLFLIRSSMDALVVQRAPEGGTDLLMIKRLQKTAV